MAVVPPPAVPSSLELFHPVIAGWFAERYGEPTPVQAAAWPEIAAGRHVLATAPTGSGKTLTAFLWALDRLLSGAWEGGATRVLYVSPLRALNADIERNLLSPLAELEATFRAADAPCQPVRVATRSGDTPGPERQRMLRRPPEVLITTPESLNILLTSRGGRSLLGALATVILDEIHAVAGSKRGTHLATAVERLVPLSGEFQRLALSATVRPLERVARFVGGRILEGEDGGEGRYRDREVAIVAAGGAKAYDLRVASALPETAPPPDASTAPAEPPPNAWDALAAELAARIGGNRSTLVFANSRRTTEKLTRLLNAGAPGDFVYSHHGSLSREIRQVVERRLKEGSLAGIVATNSLELGIDIGALDEVILVQTPPTVASAVQRVGRAGHGVGEVSRARLYPLFERDLLDAAVVARAVLDGDVEEVRPVPSPLDVLAQIVLSMAAAETWSLDRLYAFVRATDPYRDLPRRAFDLVLEMLAGRYADARVRELEPRVTIDRLAGTVRARPGAARLLYASGGTIPDRGSFHLRLADSLAKLGELDEEFVWERALGDTFTLGAQSWRIQAITHNDVLVHPAAARGAGMAPFWKAEGRDRGAFLAERRALFLAGAEADLARRGGADGLRARLAADHAMEPAAAAALVAWLERQRRETGAALPHRRHLLAEWTGEAAGEGRGRRLILHTLWGGRLNRPWALALVGAAAERLGLALEVELDDDCVTLPLPQGIDLAQFLSWVRPDNVVALLRGRLERTGFFGARFRESAGRALLLPRGDFRRRVPLWLNRQRAKQLLEAVGRHPDFPVTLETWRTCLEDEFELPALEARLGELAAGQILVSEVATVTPSPFAAGLTWRETNRLMYEDDTPSGAGGTVAPDLLTELVFASQLRPRLPESLLASFEAKLRRTHPGYAPQAIEEVAAWVEERLAVPLPEWEALLTARRRDRGAERDDTDELVSTLAARLVVARPPGSEGFVVAAQRLPRILAGLSVSLATVDLVDLAHFDRPPPTDLTDAIAAWISAAPLPAGGDLLEELIAEWARHYGPFENALLERCFGLPPERLEAPLAALVDAERLVVDRFRRDDPERLELCDAENLERLLRALRAAARPEFRARPLADLPLFLAHQQELVGRGGGIDGLRRALECLFGFAASAALWETDLLPARLDPYHPVWLDTLMQESELIWVGCGEEFLTFLFGSDLELLGPRGEQVPAPDLELGRALPAEEAVAFEELARRTALPSAELVRRLWRAAWLGEVTAGGYQPLRQGIHSGFAPPSAGAAAGGARPGRRAFDRWRAGRPLGASWRRLAAPARDLDAVEREELAKDRARLLLARYGVLFRELLARELPALQWSGVFRALRLMELSGEVLSGHFFAGVPGPQFASLAAFRRLSADFDRDAVWWVNACDPAAPCGVALEALRGAFPSRLPSSHLVFRGERPVVVSRRHGAALEIAAQPTDPGAAELLAFLDVLLTRPFAPRRGLEIETVNGEPAAKSPWASFLAERFSLTREPAGLRLRRRY